jgi:carbamoylphosphate synthase large subunit
MKDQRIVLLSSAGTGTAFASTLALRRNWGDTIKIIVADSNPQNLVTCSLISDKYYQVPLNHEAAFKDTIEKIILDENVDTYIPFIDHEIYLGALLYEEKFKDNNLTLQVRNSNMADICNDKYKTFLFLTENNILTPHCYQFDESIPGSGSLIIKPRKGFGSKVIRVSEVKENLSKYSFENYIIQEECERPEVTVDVCFDKKKYFFSYVCRERIEIKSGVCTKARLFYDKEIEYIAYKIANKLNLSSFCFQIMKNKGKWAVTDINARLGAGTVMSVATGMDFFSGMFAILWGGDPSVYFKPLQKETYVTRQYSEFVMNA